MFTIFYTFAFFCVVFASNDVVCPDGNMCPDGSTCCQSKSGAYLCCPYDQATCCSDGAHCCPNGYECDLVHMQCVQKNDIVQWAITMPTHSKSEILEQAADQEDPEDVPCGGGYCPDGTTCCQTPSGGGCCPYPNAVCCSDGTHCCPNGYTCDVPDQKCIAGHSIGINWARTLLGSRRIGKKVPVIKKKEPEDVPCGSGSCPDGTTCCPTPSGGGCCPMPSAVCCSDGVHCCPNGYTCDPPYCIAGKSINWARILLDTKRIEKKFPVIKKKEPEDVPCGSGSCPDGTTCCQTPSGGGCCPYPNAVCCSDGAHCCPNGYTCDLPHSRCVAGKFYMPLGKSQSV